MRERFRVPQTKSGLSKDAMLRHHVADGREPALSTLGFVLSGGEKLILQQCLISLKQIWKMLLEDKMRSRPQQPLHTKKRSILFENKIEEVETTLDSFNTIITANKKECTTGLGNGTTGT